MQLYIIPYEQTGNLEACSHSYGGQIFNFDEKLPSKNDAMFFPTDVGYWRLQWWWILG